MNVLSVLLAKIYVEPRPMPMDDGSCQTTFVFGTGLGVWNWLLCLADYVIQKHIIVLKSLKLSYPSLLNDF